MENELDTAYKSPAPVANYFLDASQKEDVPMTIMKLLKLVYIAYGWAIAGLNIKLFNEEIEAWQYGPVIPSIYHEFKHFGASPIQNAYAQDFNPFEDREARIPKVSKKNDGEIIDILDVVWAIYGKKSATQLMRMTHRPDTPWDMVWNKENKRYAGVIDPDCIKQYYKKVIQELSEDAA